MIVGVRRWPGWLEPLWWAVRALRAELWGFRFQYPVEAVVAPGGEDSLHYHVFSEQLFFDAMELDADGVPVQHGRTFGDAYNPAYVAWYGLMRLERAVRGEDPSGRPAAVEGGLGVLEDHLDRALVLGRAVRRPALEGLAVEGQAAPGIRSLDAEDRPRERRFP